MSMHNTNQAQTITKETTALIAKESVTIDRETILSLVDYTMLDTKASDTDIQCFKQTACAIPNLAGVCVYAHHLPLIQHPSAKKVTVINFPRGDQINLSVLGQIDAVIKVAAPDEIDYVFPYHAYLNGDKLFALEQCKQVIHRCRENDLTIKVIIESGMLPTAEVVYNLCIDILKFHPDFLKTSTGFAEVGATFNAATNICQAIIDSGSECGIKVSGCIRDPLSACQYIHLAETMMNKKADASWFRIGASQLVTNL